jgi:cell wall-associated NlpC family hydrolase
VLTTTVAVGVLSTMAAGVMGFVVVLGGAVTGSSSGLTLDVPAVPDQSYVPWLEQAGSLCPEVSAALLAAQIEQESGWDPTDVSGAGAEGISQFMPGTWPSWDQPPAVPGPDTPFVPADAIMAQGRYDCALARQVATLAQQDGEGITALVLAAYNAGPEAVIGAGGVPPIPQTQAYVSAVLADVATYTEQLANPGASSFDQAEIAAAQQWLGTPYSWGGGGYDGPSLGAGTGAQTVGFDCSGLVMYAVYQASGGSIALPHSSELQATLGQAVASGSGAEVLASGLLQPGDVIAFALDGPGDYDHIGIYVGNSDMIDAPETGSFVRVDNLADSYWGSVPWEVRSFG